jgi:hypothetical protein
MSSSRASNEPRTAGSVTRRRWFDWVGAQLGQLAQPGDQRGELLLAPPVQLID